MTYPRPLLLALLFVAMTGVACSDDDSATTTPDAGEVDMSFRPAIDVPNAPVTDMGTPENNANNTEGDAGTDGPDLGDCPQGACLEGAVKCSGEKIQQCVADLENPGCGFWTAPVDCASPQEACIQGACQIPMGCIDNDNDAHGVGCDAGPDCDDADPDRFPNNPEICDGKDNDCNGAEDDGLGIGQSCTIGQGLCTSTGVSACDAQGMIYCDAAAPTGSPEICDGQDNDCDMAVDEDMVCNNLCAQDPNEPNDTLATATTSTVGTRTLGVACPNDPEFFTLQGLQNNRTYRVYVSYPQAVSDIDLVLYVNGQASTLAPDRSVSGDYEFIEFQASPNTTYAVEAVNTGGAFNAFWVSAFQPKCAAEDGFEPNDGNGVFADLFPNWQITAALCADDIDIYDLGETTAGNTVTVDMFDDLPGYGDLDLELWGDPDGDGTLQRVDRSAFNGTDEGISYLVPATTRLFAIVVDWDGDGDRYELVWDAQ